jgi:ankyrin repeat protein
MLCYIRQDGWTAMMHAARYGRLEIVSLLMERGANMDLQDKVRLYHPLHPSSLLTTILYPPGWCHSHDNGSL